MDAYKNRIRSLSSACLVATFLLIQVWSLPAGAAAPTGACCFNNLTCEVVDSFSCETQGGSFIGAGTTCDNIDCSGRTTAPVLSILGIVGMAGALCGLGAYRLLKKRG